MIMVAGSCQGGFVRCYTGLQAEGSPVGRCSLGDTAGICRRWKIAWRNIGASYINVGLDGLGLVVPLWSTTPLVREAKEDSSTKLAETDGLNVAFRARRPPPLRFFFRFFFFPRTLPLLLSVHIIYVFDLIRPCVNRPCTPLLSILRRESCTRAF